jgi:hypothetical protein
MRLVSHRIVAPGMALALSVSVSAPAGLALGLLLVPRTARAVGEITGRLGGFVYVAATKDGLAGVTLKIRSKQLIGGEQSTTTADDGSYDFQNLPPGTYELTANIEGFTPVRLTNIQVNAGQKAPVDIALQIGAPQQAETYQIIEKVNPVLNPESAVAVTTVSNEKASKTPVFRQVQSMAQLTPGVGPGSSPSVRGGLSRYTRFLIDGLDTTDIVIGGISSPVNFDAVEQFVIFAGAMDAEYNSLGLVQNMVTRSGGNKFSVDASITLQPTFLSTPTRYTLPAPQQNGPLLYDDRPQPARDFYSANVNLGGPIVKDRLWFYSSFQFNYNRQTQNMPAVPWYPGLDSDYDRFRDTFTYLGRLKLTWQATRSTRIALSFNIDRNYITNSSGSTTLLPEAERRVGRGGEWLVLLWDSLLTPKLLFQLQAGVTLKRSVDEGILRDRVTPAHTVRSNDATNGFTYLNSAGGWNDEDKLRVQFDPTLLYNFRWLGEHNVKGGMQFSYMRYAQNLGTAGGRNYTDNLVRQPDGRAIPCDPRNPLTFAACNQVTEYPDSVPNADGTPGAGYSTTAHAINIGFFLQDRYTVGRWLTVVPGMRVDVGQLYDYQSSKLATLVGFGPRLSLVYDLLHDRSTLIEAHYGRHNDVGNAFIAARGNPFQVSQRKQWNPMTNTFDLRTMSGGPGGQVFAENLSPPKLDEVGAGVHREVITQLVAGVDYTFRRYSNLWVNEEVNQIWDPAGTRIIGFANGQRQTIYTASTPDEAQRNYHGVDFWLKGNPGNWDIVASYTLSFAEGNVIDYFDGYGYNARLRPLFYGPLSDNYKHFLKGAVDYHFTFGLDIAVRFQFLTGAPQWKVFQSPEDLSFNLYRSPRGTDTGTRNNDPLTWAEFKLPDQFNMDLELRYSLEKLTRQRIDIMFLAFNILNNAIPNRIDARAGTNYGFITGRLENFLAEFIIRYRY